MSITEDTKLKNELLFRLHLLWWDYYKPTTDGYERLNLYGHCEELGLLLLELFGVSAADLDLVKEYTHQFVVYHQKKEGGYCLTSDCNGNRICLKDGKVVDPKFWLPDNGIGDERALEAENVFNAWKAEHRIDEREWMKEADIV